MRRALAAFVTAVVPLTLGGVVVSMPATALAQAPAQDRRSPERVRALELFEQSARAYREGRFQDSVDLLLEARRVKAEPVLLYNLGRAYEALGKPIDAAQAYELYLREDPKAADRRAIEGRIATLRAQAAELEKARADLPPAEERPIPSQDRQDRSDAPHEREATPSIAPWILAGSGIAVLGAGVVLGVVAEGRHDDAVAERRQEPALQKQESAETFATASTVTLIAGSVLAAVGIGWLGFQAFSSPSSPTSSAPPVTSSVRLLPGLGAFTLKATF